MNDLEIHRKLSGFEVPLFTISQLEAVFGTDYNGTVVKLSRLVNKGVLIRVLRGMYSLPDTDPLCILSFIENPSYISLWAALRYHGLTDQSPRIIDVINARRSENIALDHYEGKFEMRFIRTRPDRMFGYSRENIGGHSCFMADAEKTIVDCLLYPSNIPMEETIDALHEGMDLGKLIDHTNRIGKQSLKKRMGYLLERSGFDVRPEMFGKLSSTYVRLDPSGERRGTYDRKWHILQNGVQL
ncbi:MAG: type IV toxin-antitoxin system AbiEi family antitoxin domain-containing protein [Thermoplasmata archaeon]|nr:type IV toxin-antitoxin system AbiEi family antitoxin domain-containing protein [Thermoplasmata archaeon]